MIYYGYRKCSTCRAALQWLADHQISVVAREIRETPPTVTELAMALKWLGGDRKKLLNTGGAEYRAMGLKERMGSLSDAELFALIQQNGNLCKRPFLFAESAAIVLTGFDQEHWHKALLAQA